MYESLSETITRIMPGFIKKRRGLIKFIITGSINTVIDLALFFILANIFYINPVISSIVSTGVTLCLSFFLNHAFVFRSQQKRHRVAMQFVAITLFNVWVIQSSIIALSIALLSGSEYFTDHIWTLNLLAKLSGISVSMLLNFLGYRHIFKEKE